ncbi:MAG: RluA family pseudouridine synthase [Bacteroidales bacterium]|nr:RluA family pseudouridine synthase [Bacteroidales bacterium]MCM1415807.1 RluA family pseudouridine synthase [bacterium]MCM1422699.1 RluA family pseudouridine synthase [bacterium]
MNHEWILYEDDDILVCHKPAGIATQTARIGQADMVSEAENYLARNLPQGNGGGKTRPRIHAVHRLDQPVEGVLVFAKQQAATAALSAQAAGEEMEKTYLALICDLRGEEKRKREDTLMDYLCKDGKTNMSHVVPPEVKGAKTARLRYEILSAQETPGVMLVRIRLYTGRHHQIRVQMAHAGMPLLGDRKYADGETIALSERLGIRDVSLCAYRLCFRHPKTGERLCFEITPQGPAFRGIRF